MGFIYIYGQAICSLFSLQISLLQVLWFLQSQFGGRDAAYFVVSKPRYFVKETPFDLPGKNVKAWRA